MSYFSKRIQAFRNAFSGLAQAFKTEVHFKLFLGTALLVIGFGLYCRVTQAEWFMLLIAMALVISLELFNSAIEKLCDLVMPEKHPKIKFVKDVTAAAVLLACIFAGIIGLMIFVPYFL